MSSAIGFFDSGIGGTTVLRETAALLPNESTVYIADIANCPYGIKSTDFVIKRSIANTDELLRCGCKMVVVACNTATAAAIDTLRGKYPAIPFVGMEPAVKPAALATKSKIVGVLATAGTLQGRLFKETARRCSSRAKVIVQCVNGWVEAVEQGKTAITPETIELVRSQIQPLLDAGADSLVLGCTHFPFLREVIAKVAGPSVTLYDPAPAVARHIKDVLENLELLATPDFHPTHEFITTEKHNGCTFFTKKEKNDCCDKL